jgi:hypothetical protein
MKVLPLGLSLGGGQNNMRLDIGEGSYDREEPRHTNPALGIQLGAFLNLRMECQEQVYLRSEGNFFLYERGFQAP